MGNQPSCSRSSSVAISSPVSTQPNSTSACAAAALSPETCPTLIDPKAILHGGTDAKADHAAGSELFQQGNESPPPLSRFLRPATQEEIAEVLPFYLRNPVPHYDIQAIEIVENPKLLRRFQSRVASDGNTHKSNKQANLAKASKAGDPTWLRNLGTAANQVYQRFVHLSASYAFPQCSSIRFLPLWYRPRSSPLGRRSRSNSIETHSSELDTIVEYGYDFHDFRNDDHKTRARARAKAKINAKNDDDDEGEIYYYGKGVQAACEAEHAWQLQRDRDRDLDGELLRSGHGDEESGVLLLNWVGFQSMYPVVSQDGLSSGLSSGSSSGCSSISGSGKLPHYLHDYDGLFMPVKANYQPQGGERPSR